METDRLMERPFAISSAQDIDKLMNLLENMDLLENMAKQRKNTKWVFQQAANIVYYVNKTNYLLGTGECVLLLEYILENRSIYPLIYDDHLCLFCCLALYTQHKTKYVERLAKRYLKQWFIHPKVKLKDFKGVSLSDMSRFEKFFSVNVNVYCLEENKTATVKYQTSGRFPSTLNCNAFGTHLSYIKDFRKHASKYQCLKCAKHFKTLKNITDMKRDVQTKEPHSFIQVGT